MRNHPTLPSAFVVTLIRRSQLFAPVTGLLLILAASASGEEIPNPLQPPDRSSPRATLATFLEGVDRQEFFAIREDVLLRILEIVEECGSGFAFPAQTLYLARDRGIDETRSGNASEEVRQWRDQGRLPFPNFSEDEKSRLQGTIPYPPPGSPDAVASDRDPDSHPAVS